MGVDNGGAIDNSCQSVRTGSSVAPWNAKTYTIAEFTRKFVGGGG